MHLPHTTTSLRWLLHAALPFMPLATGHAASIEGRQPNIILCLADDMGYGDISAHGNPIVKTPHLDAMRAEGLHFDDFHVSPSCSPTRSALLTGRHEFKNGVTHTKDERERLALGAITLAQVLQRTGYATGIFGKWHLGDEDPYLPKARGFDEMFIFGGGVLGKNYMGSCGDAPGNSYFDPTILHNEAFVRTKGYCTDVFFHQATEWMDAQRKSGRPFFAFIPTNAPHAPCVAKPDDAGIYQGRTPSPAIDHFYGMIHNIDENIGSLLAKVREWGIERETLVIFMSDNGGDSGLPVFNAGMRGGKLSAWQGGTRASSFWRWPGTISPGGSKALTAHIDVFPTIGSIAGATFGQDVKDQIEGRSLVPLLADAGSAWPERTLFVHRGRWPRGDEPDSHKYNGASVRTSRWSLVSVKGGVNPEWQLFDLSADYGQKNDVAKMYPDIVRDLSGSFDKWWDECRKSMINEHMVGPKLNAFAVRYWKQFGGGPSEEDYKKMTPPKTLLRQLPAAHTAEDN